MTKLKDRYGEGKMITRKKVWFWYGKWSILDCGELMKTNPIEGIFDGWEALSEDGTILRNETWELLKKDIEEYGTPK